MGKCRNTKKRYKGGTKSKSKSKSKSTSKSKSVSLSVYNKLEDENKRLTEMYIKLEAELDRCKQIIKKMRSFLNLT
jgi:hypothetical protein